MREILVFLWILIGITSLILQMVFFLRDDRAPNHTTEDLHYKWWWHLAEGAIHLWMGATLSFCFGVQYGLLMLSLLWYFYDGAVNTWVLKREWFYIGTTAQVDIAQQQLAKKLKVDPRTLSAVLK